MPRGAPIEAEARERAERLFQQRPEWWLPAAAETAGTRVRHIVYRIHVDEITGRRAVRNVGRIATDTAT